MEQYSCVYIIIIVVIVQLLLTKPILLCSFFGHVPFLSPSQQFKGSTDPK